MKKLLTTLSFSLIMGLLMLGGKKSEAQVSVGVSINFQTFYDQLSPYGDWINYPDYGYTWRPRIGSDFRPYSSGGHWAYANNSDWMWVSDYDWGWAPFHYGRWFNDPMYGWLWVPGYEWAPAWVAWRGGGDYYGWAPLRPGFSISIGFGSYNPPYDYWTFAPGRYMTSKYIGRYYYPYRNNVTIINRTTIINNYGGRGRSRYAVGPARRDVERYTGRIRTVNVRDAARPGRTSVRGNDVAIYRPRVERTSRGTSIATPAPKRVQEYRGDRTTTVRSTASGVTRNSTTNRVRTNAANNATRNNGVTDRSRTSVSTSRDNNGGRQRTNEVRQRQSTNANGVEQRTIQRQSPSSMNNDHSSVNQAVRQRNSVENGNRTINSQPRIRESNAPQVRQRESNPVMQRTRPSSEVRGRSVSAPRVMQQRSENRSSRSMESSRGSSRSVERSSGNRSSRGR